MTLLQSLRNYWPPGIPNGEPPSQAFSPLFHGSAESFDPGGGGGAGFVLTGSVVAHELKPAMVRTNAAT